MKGEKVLYFKVVVALKGTLPRSYSFTEEARQLLESGESRFQKVGWCLIRGPFKRVRKPKTAEKIKGEFSDTLILSGNKWKPV